MSNRRFHKRLKGGGPAALGLLLCLAPFTAWAQDIADSPEHVRPLLIGTPAPELHLKTDQGEDFDLDKALSEKPTILILYRGSW